MLFKFDEEVLAKFVTNGQKTFKLAFVFHNSTAGKKEHEKKS